jgi:hypothetical protein
MWLYKGHKMIVMGCTQMSFFPEILEIGTPTILEAHNFLCKPLIGVRSKTKL